MKLHSLFEAYRLRRVGYNLVLSAFLMMGLTSLAQIPSGYYNSATGKSGNALALALHEIIDDHTRFPYTASTTDTWDLLAAADQDPNNGNNVLTLYKNQTKPKSDHNQGTGWNREHTWAKSLGFPTDDPCNYPYTDAHHLMAEDWDYNSARSNKPFDNCTSGCTEWVPVNASSSNWTNADTWEPWDDIKGDVARAMFYMAVRYNGGSHGVTGCAEPDLRLTNDRALIQTFSSNQSVGYMGILSTLLAWHAADPVDGYEQSRNDVVYSFQGNRNPFVDHPEWVSSIFGGGDGSGGTGSGGGGGGGGGTLWINELHYDNSSTDVNEGVEVAGAAGTSLSGWQLVAYNGSGGASYLTVNLSGTLANQSNGFGTAFFAMTGLQNGAPDGIALVNAQGNVVEFISYEGSFTATNGPANGMASSDIGVTEAGSVSGSSLQLGGTGNTRADFSWQTERTATRNAVNGGQSFTSAGGGGGTWTVLNLNNFESGMSGYTDGGTDCIRGAYSGYAHQGSYCVQLRDDTSTSNLYTTSSYNYTSYSELRISFWFKANGMETGENFFVEFNQNGSWVVIDDFVAGTDFSNGSYVNPQIVLSSSNYSFAASRFRIRCDASDDTDQVYIDEIEIAGR